MDTQHQQLQLCAGDQFGVVGLCLSCGPGGLCIAVIWDATKKQLTQPSSDGCALQVEDLLLLFWCRVKGYLTKTWSGMSGFRCSMLAAALRETLYLRQDPSRTAQRLPQGTLQHPLHRRPGRAADSKRAACGVPRGRHMRPGVPFPA